MQGRKRERISIGDFYEEQVLPALFDRLDQAFPEFGWKRTSRGWTATNREHTKTLTGAAPRRVVCNQPWGFYVHGGAATSWPAYVHGSKPTGVAFVETVKDLANRAGVDASVLDRPLSPEEAERHAERERRGDLLETFLTQAHVALLDDVGKSGQSYLAFRGFGNLEEFSFGYFTTPAQVKRDLQATGFSEEEIHASNLLADGRWTGRLLIPWRDRWGRLSTIAARDLTGNVAAGPIFAPGKYLYLKGGMKPPAFGLDVALRDDEGRRNLVLVEGLLDVVSLQAKGFPNVAALGGQGNLLTADRWNALTGYGVRSVTLALDNDEAGKEGLLAALDNLQNVDAPPTVYVVDPSDLAEAKDPDELVRTKGLPAFLELAKNARPGAVYRGLDLLANVDPKSPDPLKREAVERVLDYDATLRGPRAALDREDLLGLTAERTGFSYEALLDVAEGHTARRRREEAEKGLQRALRDAQAGLGDRDYRDVAHDLTAELAILQARTEEPPPPFSVDRLDAETRDIPQGKPSGWMTLDALEVRFNAGELAILGARTGHGKTTALVGLFYNWLQAGGDELLILYSAEEPEVRIYHRLLALASYASGKPWTVNEVRDFLRGGLLSRGEDYSWPGANLDAEKRVLRAWEDRLLVVYRPAWSAEDIAAHARNLAQGRQVGGVLVDYLQRLPASPGRFDRRDQEISAAGRTLKHLAVDLACPAVAAAQINREAIPQSYAEKLNKTQDFDAAEPIIRTARPDLHHLREGGSEQEADLVLGLLNYAADYRQDAQAATLPRTTLFEVGVLKNRYGEVGQWAALAFEGRYGLLRDETNAAKYTRRTGS